MKLVAFTSCLISVAACAEDPSSDLSPRVASTTQAIGVVPRGSTCAELGLGGQSFTIANPVDGDYAIDSQNSLKFRYYDSTHTDFFFTQSTIRMTGVLASNGDRTMMWEMPGGADGWPSLTGPPDPGTDTVHTPEEVTFCYDNELYVQPSPVANRTQRALWSITKTGRTSALILGEGQSASVQYNVAVRSTGAVALGQSISGPVFVQNKSPNVVTVGSVTTLVGGVAAPVACPLPLPFTMQPFTLVECSFSADVPDTSDRVVLGGGTVSHGLKVSTREATASFSAPNSGTTTIDRCIAVADEAAPGNHSLGTACVEQGPVSFPFSLVLGPYACGAFSVTNTASFATFDTAATGTSSWTVNGEVICNPGCTSKWEYWRDHSDLGPHAQDPTWDLLGPQSENTTFFRSGVSYIQSMYVIVLPLLNPYWTLSREYIAARLNQLTGVAMPAATAAAFNEATALFNANTPLQIQLNLFLHGRIHQLTSTLASFNDGHTGPGACAH